MAQDATETAREPSLGELVASATRDLSILIHSEVALAKAELGAEVKKAATGGVAFGGAAVVGIFAFVLLSFAGAYGLTEAGLPVWAGFAIVGGAYLLIAAVLGIVGVVAVKKLGPPERTLRTTKETVAVLRTRFAAARSDADSRI